MVRRSRVAALCGAALLATALVAGCTPGTAPAPLTSPTADPEGTIEFWHFFTDREATAIAEVVHDFEATHPKIHVVIKDGQDDAKMTQAISAGQGPDLGLSYSTDIVGKFCHSGAWVDLNPYISRDHVDMAKIPASVQSYTRFENKQCTMPFLADTYGLYYNKDMFTAAGISGPPHTLAELADDAKRLTKRKADGTIEVAGFLPLFGFYENSPAHVGPSVDAKWLTALFGGYVWARYWHFIAMVVIVVLSVVHVFMVFAVDPYSLPSMFTGNYDEKLSPEARNARPFYHLFPRRARATPPPEAT